MERLLRRVFKDRQGQLTTLPSTTSAPAVINPPNLEERVIEVLDNNEVLDLEETKKWEAAYFGENIFHTQGYAVTLSPSEDLAHTIYASLEQKTYGTEIDIPLVDPTPDSDLVTAAYKSSTFFGELDPDKFRQFATNWSRKEQLLAFLNRQTAGVPEDDIIRWFLATFDVKHNQNYGDVYISSHGSWNSDNLTISPRRRERNPFNRGYSPDMSSLVAHRYAQVANASLPQMDITPLAINDYLRTVQDTLHFLPQDWTS
ncbi:MAG TPA: hypothetical protein VG935_02705 [Patescibacteria group bacterium]|nr:hypothetical protein [Patescibacteria group bacterium]